MLPAGYLTMAGFDPAEDHIGPFYFKPVESGFEFMLVAAQKHCNAVGIVHGGVLMTFADYCACMQATNNYAVESCVTLSFNSEFIAAAEIGSNLQCKVEINRKTGSLVFLSGKITTTDQLILTFSTVLKRLRS